MKQRKKWIALMLALALVLSTVVPAFATVSGTAGNIDRNGDDTFYYVALGDSVTAGYALPDVPISKAMTPLNNYKSSSPNAYPYQVAQNLFDCLQTQGYLDSEAVFGCDDVDKGTGALGFGWSNMGISSFTTADIANAIHDPEYIPGFWNIMDPALIPLAFGEEGDQIHPAEYKFHDILWQELGKADLITLFIGSNDLMQGLSLSSGNNPLLASMSDLTGITEFDSAAMSDMVAQLGKRIAANKITTNDVTELLKMMTPEGIRQALCDNARKAVADYPATIAAIREVNPDAQLLFIGGYNPYGTSLTLANGQTYNITTIVNEMMEVIVRAVAESGDSEMMDAVVQEVDAKANISEVSALMEQMAQVDAPAAPMTAAQEKKAANLWDNDWLNWLKWTEENVNSWTNWSNSTWQAWAQFAQRTNSVEAMVGNAYHLAQRYGHVDFETSRAMLAKMGIDPELVGSEEDVIALATSVITNYTRWQKALDKFRTIGQEAQAAALEDVLAVLQYPAMYFTAAKTTASALHTMNSGIEAYARQEGIPYVDIYDGMPNKSDLDPHPQAAGHTYMSDQISAVLFPSVTVQDGDSVVTQTVLYGSDMTYTVTPDAGYHVDSVSVNGKAVSLSGDQVTLENVTENMNLTVTYALNPVQPPVQPAVRHHVPHSIFGVVRTLLRWIPFFGR